ncbi:hypothetical protein ACLOJK_022603 [Asimina triloba]
MGGVFLGMPGLWAEDDCESSDHYTTKIGGLPDWPVPETDVEPGLLKCGVCGSRLCLVAQVYAPIDMGSVKVSERTIYVMGCIMQGCGSSPLSWRTLRFQKTHNEVESSISSQKEEAPSEMVTNSKNWWEDLLKGGDKEGEDVDLEELGRALSEAGSLASHIKKQNGHTQSDTISKDSPIKSSPRAKDYSIPVVPCFYIYAQEEQSSNDLSSVCANYSSLSIKGNKSDVDDNDDDHRDEEKWEVEAYEYDRALTADRTYLKFKKWMDAYPEQCFRYSYGGKPLFASTSVGEPGSCMICGGSRHYEMQLMPPLVYFLRQAELFAPIE